MLAGRERVVGVDQTGRGFGLNQIAGGRGYPCEKAEKKT